MSLSGNLMNDELLQQATMEQVIHLQQEILQSPHETNPPREALMGAYERLTDEQKVAFILAGGGASLFHYRRHSAQQMRTGSDTETGQLPVLC